MLDQCVPEEFNWPAFSGIIQNAGIPMSRRIIGDSIDWLVDLFDRKESHSTFPQVFSHFLMDQARAGHLWVNSHGYANLAKQILKILCDE